MQGKHAVYIRAKDGALVNRINDFISLHILMTLNNVGSWSISSTTAEKCPFSAGDGIIDVRDGKYFYGGVVTQISDVFDATTGLYNWKVSGKNDLEYLKRRLCYVDPASGSTSGTKYYTASGDLLSVVHNLISRNIGENAMTDRRESIIRDNQQIAFSPDVTVNLRFQNLLQTVSALVTANGWNIRAQWDSEADKVYYELYEGRNLTENIVFTEQLNNILSSEYIASVPEGNFILAGGAGEGTSRTFVNASNNTSITEWGRVELFQDGRNQEVLSDYTNEVLSEKSVNNVGYGCSVSTMDLAPQFGVDYDLGDLVGMKVHGQFVTAEVQQCEISVEGGVESIQSRFGTIAVGKFNVIYKQLRSLRRDVDELLGTEVE